MALTINEDKRSVLLKTVGDLLDRSSSFSYKVERDLEQENEDFLVGRKVWTQETLKPSKRVTITIDIDLID